MVRATGILWIGPVGDIGGYGNVSRNYLKALSKQDIPVSIINTANLDIEIGQEEINFLNEMNCPIENLGDFPILIIHGTPDSFNIDNHNNFYKTIGITIFETDRIPTHWVEKCNQMDEIWVPSEFNINTFSNSGVIREKLKLVPYCIDVNQYENMTFEKFSFSEGTNSFKFLYTCAFDFRKGIDILIKAYCEEFQSDEDVSLVLKLYTPNWMKDIDINKILNSYLPPKTNLPDILLILEKLNRTDLYNLYNSCDCYISTDRANGWGMPSMEMMAMGKPAITINWSGSTQFMNKSNAFLIQPEQEFEPVDNFLQTYRPNEYKGHMWPKVNVKEIRTVMREAYENPIKREKLSSKAQKDMKELYSIHNISLVLRDILSL